MKIVRPAFLCALQLYVYRFVCYILKIVYYILLSYTLFIYSFHRLIVVCTHVIAHPYDRAPMWILICGGCNPEVTDLLASHLDILMICLQARTQLCGYQNNIEHYHKELEQEKNIRSITESYLLTNKALIDDIVTQCRETRKHCSKALKSHGKIKWVTEIIHHVISLLDPPDKPPTNWTRPEITIDIQYYMPTNISVNVWWIWHCIRSSTAISPWLEHLAPDTSKPVGAGSGYPYYLLKIIIIPTSGLGSLCGRMTSEPVYNNKKIIVSLQNG